MNLDVHIRDPGTGHDLDAIDGVHDRTAASALIDGARVVR